MKYGKKLQAAFAQPGRRGACATGSTPARTTSTPPCASRAAPPGGRIWRATSAAIPAIRALLDGHDDAALAAPDDQSRRPRPGGAARGVPRCRGRPAALLHRLHGQGLGPAVRRPQGQPCRADDARADGGPAARAQACPRARNGRRGRARRGARARSTPSWHRCRSAGASSATTPRRCRCPRSCRRAAAAATASTQEAFGRIMGELARSDLPLAGAHRHHLARRHGLDQPRRLGRPARACSAAASTRTSSAPSRCSRRHPGGERTTGPASRAGHRREQPVPQPRQPRPRPRAVRRPAPAGRHALRPVHRPRPRCPELCLLPGRALPPGGHAVGHHAGAGGRRPPVDRHAR